MTTKTNFNIGKIPPKNSSTNPMSDVLGKKKTNGTISSSGSGILNSGPIQDNIDKLTSTISEVANSSDSAILHYPVSNDAEVSQTKDDKYEYSVGLTNQSPAVIASFDFVPIYSGENFSEAGAVINLQDVVDRLNTRTCTSIFKDFPDLITAIDFNKKSISDIIDRHTSLSTIFLRKFGQIYPILDPITNEKIIKFYNLHGYKKSNLLEAFSNSKAWIQYVELLKREFVSHSETFFGNQPKARESQNQYEIDEIAKPEDKRWMNWKILFDKQVDDFLDYNQINTNLKLINTIHGKIIRDFYGDNVYGDYFDATDYDTSLLFYRYVIDKEARISNYMISQEGISYLGNKFGYTISPNGNSEFWDYLFGRFSTKIYDFPLNPAGGNQSLVGFAKYQSGGVRILTLEKNYLDISNATPGIRYFVDTTVKFDTSRGGNFETAQLSEFIKLISDCKKTVEIIANVSGLTVSGEKSAIINSGNSTGINFDTIDAKLNFANNVQINSNVNEDNQIEVIYNASNLYTHIIPMSFIKMIAQPSDKFKHVQKDLFSNFFMYLFANANSVVSNSAKSQASLIANDCLSNIANILINNVHNDPSASNKKKLSEITISNGYYQSSVTQVKDNYETFGEKNKSQLENTTIDKFIKMISDSPVIKSCISVFSDIKKIVSAWGNKSKYTGISQTAIFIYVFQYILKVIACQTFTNFQGVVAGTKIVYHPTDISENKETTTTWYFKVDLPNFALTNNQFRVNANNEFESVYLENVKISHFIEYNNHASNLDAGYSFLTNLYNQLVDLKSNFDKSSAIYARDVYDALSGDETIDKEDIETYANMSLTGEQLILSSWSKSELLDRMKESGIGNITNVSGFSNCTLNDYKFFDYKDFRHVSFSILKDYFKSAEFQIDKSNNKQIISIGIPNGLIRAINQSLHLPTGGEFPRSFSTIKIKVFKIDHLFPNLVFKPIEFLFQIDRFGTCIASNWEKQENFNLLFCPTKIVKPDGSIKTFASYLEAFPFGEDAQGVLTNDQTLEIYTNHVKSFILSEYVRWFTSSDLQDDKFHHFGTISQNSTKDAQSTLANSFSNNNEFNPTGDILISYKDPASGNTYTISSKSKIAKSKQLTIPFNNSIETFTTSHDTFLTNYNVLARDFIFPKKFDRVFNVVVDPDDFEVDINETDKDDLSNFIKSGHALKVGTNYKKRDTSPDEPNYYEFFTTVEPI